MSPFILRQSLRLEGQVILWFPFYWWGKWGLVLIYFAIALGWDADPDFWLQVPCFSIWVQYHYYQYWCPWGPVIKHLVQFNSDMWTLAGYLSSLWLTSLILHGDNSTCFLNHIKHVKCLAECLTCSKHSVSVSLYHPNY